MFKGILRKIQKAQERRVAYWQLQNLSDKDLYDIGINRSQIRSVIYSGE
jgi:uncharacterized protein YjiS (DUF1127 family)